MKRLLIILVLIYIFYNCKFHKLNKRIYDVNEVYPELNIIKSNFKKIQNEVFNIKNIKWDDCPEKDLYDNGDWKILPFYAFDNWIPSNCNKCPIIYDFLKNIPNLKVALLSKLSPKMTLNPHHGWAFHSNYILRCHYGIFVPDNCYILVKDNNGVSVKYHKENEWMVFDDSKLHYAGNDSEQDRIILIIDIERPKNVALGESQSSDTDELNAIINYYKNKK